MSEDPKNLKKTLESAKIELAKKYSNFPCPGQIFRGEGQPAIPGEILKLTEIGFLVNAGVNFFKVGENCIIDFTLPGTETILHENAKVIKTYLSYNPTNPAEKNFTVEMHFRSLQDEQRNAIKSCLKRIASK